MKREHLFSNNFLPSALDNHKLLLGKTIDEAPASMFQGRSVDELTTHFLEQFVVACPELTEGAISVTVGESQIDVRNDFHRAVFDRSRPCYVQGIVATYFVPFSGDRNIFQLQPSTSYLVYPIAEIGQSELVFRFESANSDVAATKTAFDSQLKLVLDYLGHARKDIDKVNTELPDVARARVSARIARLQKIGSGLQALGMPVRGAGADPAPPPAPPKAVAPAEKYDVAFSFAGEDRAYVEQVATILKTAGVSVFYDNFEKVNLWGKNLIDHLAEIYQKRSRFVVMFISKHYVGKPWPGHERTHAQARALLATEEYILPARFDDTEVPGLAGTVGYVSLQGMAPQDFADLIRQKIATKK